MGIYAYECPACFRTDEKILPVAERDTQQVCECGKPLVRVQKAGFVRMPGGNSRINYADQFTADALGIPVGELPSGLHTPK